MKIELDFFKAPTAMNIIMVLKLMKIIELKIENIFKVLFKAL